MTTEGIAVCGALALYFLLLCALISAERTTRGADVLRAPGVLGEGHASRCADQATPLDGGAVREVRTDDSGDRDSEEARHARRELDAWEPDETIGVDQHTAERRARLRALQQR